MKRALLINSIIIATTLSVRANWHVYNNDPSYDSVFNGITVDHIIQWGGCNPQVRTSSPIYYQWQTDIDISANEAPLNCSAATSVTISIRNCPSAGGDFPANAYGADATFVYNGCGNIVPPTPGVNSRNDMPRLPGKGHDPDCPPPGMPVWRVSEPWISLWVGDVPLTYQPALGPPIAFSLNFGQYEAVAGYDTNIFGIGKKWNFSWNAYVTSDWWGNGVVHFPEGGSRTYTNGVLDYLTNTKLTGSTNTGYTLTYPDGSSLLFNYLVTNTSGAFLKAFMTDQVSPSGQKTRYTYTASAATPPVVRLQSVIDGDGRATSISYVTNNLYSTNLISQVTDPFGRTALLGYDTNGHLTNITDVASLASYPGYDAHDWITNLITPYGTNSFRIGDTEIPNIIPNGRWIEVSEPNNAKQLYLFTNSAAGVAASYSGVPGMGSYTNILDNSSMDLNNSFHWNRLQYSALSSAYRNSSNILQLTTNDFLQGRMRHWLRAGPVQVSETLSMERAASPDGSTPGQRVYYDYEGKTNTEYAGTQVLPLFVTFRMPDGTTNFVRTERNSLGAVTRSIATWSATAGGPVQYRTNTYLYWTNNIDLIAATNALGVRVLTNLYNSFHQVTSNYNALNEQTVLTYNGNQQLACIALPSGLVISNYYFTSGSASNRLAGVIDYAVVNGTTVYYRTNTYTWNNDLVSTHTDPRGLTISASWDPLQRLLEADFPDGTSIKNTYDRLDLVQVVNRMGFTNKFYYNALQQMVAMTNANGVVTLFEYCSCGSPLSITNALGTSVQAVTRFTYDNQGKRLTTTGPDNFVVTYNYNAIGQLTNVADPVRSVTNWFNHQGMLCVVSNALRQVSAGSVDVLDRFVQSTNANNITLSRIFDDLNRVATNTYADGGLEIFGYTTNVAGVTSYLNQNGSNVVNYIYDPFDRKIAEICPDVSTNLFSYWPAGDLKTLTNGNLKLTTWNYDIYGRVSEKLDDDNTTVFAYRYYADGTLSNRWNGGRSTTYNYDAARNLTGITYPFSPSVTFGYDALNRMTSMVDAVGSSGFSYDSIGQLLAEDGPWASDTVGYGYNNRQRASLNVEAPNASSWSQSYTYDNARRLETIRSPAGNFIYAYDTTRKLRPSLLTLPNGAFVEMDYDGMGRQWTRLLYESTGEQYLDAHAYEFDKVGQRKIHYRYNLNNQVDFTYDNAGQLKTALGSEYDFSPLRTHEQLGYAYDGAGNLAWRTNYALVQKFGVNNLNELTSVTRSGTLTVAGTTTSLATNVTVNGQTAVLFDDATFAKTNFTLADGNNTFTAIAQDACGRRDTNVVVAYLPATNAFAYDARGNLITNGQEILIYDDENRLVTNYVAGSWQSEFVYDGLNRRRIQRDYAWNGSTLVKTNETRFIYDGNVIVQHRDANNLPTLALTRGPDLSGSLQGAGGIGGLLAMTENPGVRPEHSYYHSDAGGNVTGLINTNQQIVAKAEYDPYGNFVSLSGPKAGVNPYWFSSKPMHQPSGKYDFLYRWYAPNLQRWVNQDPIKERGGLNLFQFVGNRPIGSIDFYGNELHATGASGLLIPGPLEYLRGDTTAEMLGASAYNTLPLAGNAVAQVAGTAGNFLGAIGSIFNAVVGSMVEDLGGQQLDVDNAVLAANVALIVATGGESQLSKCKVAESLSDSALVVRGGQNLPPNFVKGAGVTVDESGLLHGVSVQSAEGVDLATLSQNIPHNQVGVTTVGEVRAAGGEVVADATEQNPYHSILSGIDSDTASDLFRPTIPNPGKK